MDINIETLVRPFDDEPCGVDAAGLEIFDIIETEIDKGEGLNRDIVDWGRIVKLSVEILSNESKHLQVAAYLTYGLLKVQGYSGLVKGLSVFKGMVEAGYWEGIYPTNLKLPGLYRAKSMAWLSSKLKKEFSLLEMSENSDVTDILASIENFIGLDNAIANRLENDAPNVLEFISSLRRVKQEAQAWKQEIESKAEKQRQQDEASKAAESKVETQQGSSQTVAPANHAVPVSVVSSTPATPEAPSFSAVSKDNIDKVLKATQKTLIQLSEYFQNTDPYGANAMYLSRVAGWMIFQRAPITDVLSQNPSEETFTRLESLLQDGQNEKLLEIAENLFRNGTVIHLGLQRLVVQALQAMKKDETAATVKACLFQLIGRAPEWMENKFQGGTPFVDEKTKAWMESELNGLTGETVETESNSIEAWCLAAKHAKLHLINNEIYEGIQVFEKGINQVTSARERVYWRLEQAKFAFKAGQLNMAVNQLEYLNNQLSDNQLSHWEPDLKGEVVKSLVEAHKSRMAKQQYTPDQIKVFEKLKQELYVFDPLAAMSFEQGKK